MIIGPLRYGTETAWLEVKRMSPRIWGTRSRGWEPLSSCCQGPVWNLGILFYL